MNAADTAWMLTSTALVLLMTLPALALFYGGLVQAKNILSVLVQCAAVAALCSVLWFALGYSLAYSGNGDWLGDGAAFFLRGLTRDAVHAGTHIPESVYVMFQMTFAAPMSSASALRRCCWFPRCGC
jgi:Amt family ammonium transporter